jgi:pseudouridine-5'-phosphate glycosidase
MAVPVVGYQTEAFPAFHSRDSGLKVSAKLDTPHEIVKLAKAHWDMGMHSAIMVTNPIPIGDEIPKSRMDPWIVEASQEAEKKKIHGQDLTPFLLQRINELSNGQSMRANLTLLLNNARLAAQIARAMASTQRRKYV